MSLPVIAAVGHGSTAMWYLTRATGLVSLVLLSATVVLGIVSSMGWATERWPRFLSQAVHRNLSLFCLAVIAIHVITTVGDGYVPIGFVDAVIPFRSPYRTLWVGFGALAFDLLLAVAITSGLRRRIGVRAWRTVHWLAYLCWPIALLHGLGAGSDTRLSVALVLTGLCVAAVAGALAWRLVSGPALSPGWRVGGAVGGVAVLLGTAVFALLGPLRPGWSDRAGTSSAVLAQLSAVARTSAVSPSHQASSPTSPVAPSTTPSSSTPSSSVPSSSANALPTTPFSSAVHGTYATSKPDSAGEVTVLLTMQLQDSGAPLVVKLVGTPVNGGVTMASSAVTFGTDRGAVTALEGSTISATVTGPRGALNLTMQVNLDQATGTVTGTTSGTAAQ